MTMVETAAEGSHDAEPVPGMDGLTVGELREALGTLEVRLMDATEALGKVDMMVDAQGWHPLYEYGPDGGLTLTQLKQSSHILRELVVANPILKRGSQLRNTYVWGGGAKFSAENANGKTTAIPAAFREVLTKPKNKRYWFSNTAREEIERTAFTDGNIFALVDKRTQTAERVPLAQLTGDVRNPENPEEIWLLRREWSQGGLIGGQASQGQRTWYYTDLYEGPRRTSVQIPGVGLEAVDTSKTIVHQTFNGQSGWGYGVPDALPVVAWARLYREAMVNGYVMSKAMAQLAYKLSAPNKEAGTRMSAEVSRPGQGGRAVAVGSGQDITALGTAGRGYDFASLRPVAAHIAAGLEVSVVALLSDPSAAGSNNGGSSTTLDAPAKATAIMRRRTWDDFHERLMTALGATKTITTVWKDLPDDTVYRMMQAWALADAAGKFQPEVVQAGMADVLGIHDPGAVPEPPVMAPGVDPNGDPNGVTPTGQSKTDTGTTGQGKSKPGGTAPNDHSTDSKS